MLRDYQVKIATQACEILKKLHIVYLAMEMRTGKTLTALATAEMLGKKNVLFITKKKAIKSIEADYEQLKPKYKLKVINDHFSNIEKEKPEYDCYIIDEAHCFLGDTKIGSRKIKDLKIADYVQSYNHQTFMIENKPVLNIFKNEIKSNLIQVNFNSKSLICTENHKFYVDGKGYIPAKLLTKGDYCYENNELQNMSKRNRNQQQGLQDKFESCEKRSCMLFGRMFTQVETYSLFNKKRKTLRYSMCELRKNYNWHWSCFQRKSCEKYCNMLQRLSTSMEIETNFRSINSRIQRSQFGTNENKQSNAHGWSKRKDDWNTKIDRTSTQDKRRQWVHIESRSNSTRKTWGKIHNGVCGNNTDSSQKRIQNTELLQIRFCRPAKHAGDRNRRPEPLFVKSKKSRCEKNGSIGKIRVENIEIYKQRNDERFTYNIEVEGNNNYFAEGILVHNCCGSFPKPSSRSKHLKALIKKNDLIMLSGTPSPETYGSQLFHQFYLSEYNPFNIENFYKWAKLYVNIKEKFISGVRHNDYSDAKKDDIMCVVSKYFITYTQEEAGFKEDIKEFVHEVDIDKRIYVLINILRRDKIYQFKNSEDTIICDTPVKEQNKIHQLCSGTIITENREYKILDYSKANYIKENFVGKKIAIFYQFQAEGMALKEIFPNCTSSPEEFNLSIDKIFICQVQSGSMGVNLSTADDLIFYNINFSSVQYQQARARLSDRNRIKPIYVHWIFSKEGIEHKIYKAVVNKQDYTSQFYRKDYGEAGKQSAKRNPQLPKRAA